MGIDLVAAGPEHADRFASLLRQVHEESLGALPESIRSTLVDTQMRAQELSYAQRFPDAIDLAILVEGEVVGRLLVDSSGPALEVVDIAIFAHHRGRGVGTAALRAAIAQAPDRTARLSVRRGNPAEHLYRRLGFVESADLGTHIQMERPPLPHTRATAPEEP